MCFVTSQRIFVTSMRGYSMSCDADCIGAEEAKGSFWRACWGLANFFVCFEDDVGLQRFERADERGSFQTYVTARALLRCVAAGRGRQTAILRVNAGRVVCAGDIPWLHPWGAPAIENAYMLEMWMDRGEYERGRRVLEEAGAEVIGSNILYNVVMADADVRDTERVLRRALAAGRLKVGAPARNMGFDSELRGVCGGLRASLHVMRRVLVVWRQLRRTASIKRELMAVACRPTRLRQVGSGDGLCACEDAG